jgi:hypothetical protein
MFAASVRRRGGSLRRMGEEEKKLALRGLWARESGLGRHCAIGSDLAVLSPEAAKSALLCALESPE